MGNTNSSNGDVKSIDSINKKKLRSIVNRLGLTRRRSFDSSKSRGEGSQSSDFVSNSDFGWYEDICTPDVNFDFEQFDKTHPSLHRSLSLPQSVNEPPLYVLQANLKTQQLWYLTAGRRPKQPQEERVFFERLWLENFTKSTVNYTCKQRDNNDSNIEEKENTNAQNFASKLSIKAWLKDIDDEDVLRSEDDNVTIISQEKCIFSYSITKSFLDGDIKSMTLQIPRYRIVRCNNNDEIHAEFLIVVTLGDQNKITFGVWRRHSDFSKFALVLKENHTFKNAMLSWHCLVLKKKWLRCLDKDYLSLKCFLLERFLQDTLFESSMPLLISNFLGLTNVIS